jgi:hypothetical protein
MKGRIVRWSGDIVVKIRLREVGLGRVDFRRVAPLLDASSVWTDWLAEGVLLGDLATDFSEFVASLPPEEYDAAVNLYRHRYWGYTFDERREEICFLGHVSIVREALDHALLEAAAEGACR